MMKMNQESQSLLTKISDEKEIHFTIKMPEYELSYSIPMLGENISNKEAVSAPQLLLNNPITDPVHSEQVRKYIEEKNKDDIKLSNSEETSQKSKNEVAEERILKKPSNISVRKDLLITTPSLQKLREFRVKDKKKYENNDLFDNGLVAASKMINIVTQDLEPSRRSIEKNANFLNGKRSSDKCDEISSLKRKLVSNDTNSPETNQKASKLSSSEINCTILDDSLITKKIHLDCQWALKQDLHGNYPLHNAVLHSNFKLVKRFALVLSALNKSLDPLNFQGMSPLLLAVSSLQSSIVSYLLRMGADPAVSTDDGNTSYHLAVLRRDEKSLRELLKRSLKRQPIDMLNDKGLAPLHLAVLTRNETLVKMLLAFGARPDCQDARNGKTPIFLATELGCPGVVHLLASYGASVTLASYSGVVPAAISQEGRAVLEVVNTSQLCFRRDFMDKFCSQIK